MTIPPLRQDLSHSLEALLVRFGRMLRSVGARQGVPDDDLDALVQEVRVRLWQAQRKSEEIERLPTSYVYRTAMAAAVDMVRKRRRSWSREGGIESVAAGNVAAITRTDDSLMAADLGKAIASALATMPEARAIIVRLHLAGYERDEITSLLGRSEGSVRNLLYRGMQDLRDHLVREGYRWPEGG